MTKKWYIVGGCLFALLALFLVTRGVEPNAGDHAPGIVVQLKQTQQTSGDSTGAGKPSRSPREEAGAKQLEYENRARVIIKFFNRPGRFYGLILDEKKAPVAGISVRGSLSHYSYELPSGLKLSSTDLERVSDGEGQFTIENISGTFLDVHLFGEDYEFQPPGLQVMLQDAAAGVPAPTVSSPERPYVFQAHKKNPTNELVRRSVSFGGCIPDGRVYAISLRSQRVTEGGEGEIKIAFQRSVQVPTKEDYEWSVQISSSRLEFIQSHDTFMYVAPDSGYSNTWSFKAQPGAKDYTRIYEPKFYIRDSAEECFGRAEFTFLSDAVGNHVGFTFQFWINPTGEKNIE